MDERQIINKLVEKNHLTEANRAMLFQMQEKSKRRLLHLATEAGMFSEEEIVQLISDIYNLEKADLSDYELVCENWDGLIDFFVANQIVPLKNETESVSLAMFDPSDSMLIRSVEMGMDKKVVTCLAPLKEITHFWNDFLKTDEPDQEDDIDHMIDIASEAPVVRVVSDIMSRAVELAASDIHLEARGNDLGLRYRIDGMLHNFPSPPPGMGPAIISRIKILANLDIAERRVPQDGAIKLPTSSKEVDVRVSVMPTVHGEGVVLRILDKGNVTLNLEALGLVRENSRRLFSMLDKSYGMIVVAGPTGAGKTTTLYAALDYILSETRKVITIEDPVEFKIKGITQIQVNPKAGLTFATGLRSILRHDPDVMLVGEIRDSETAAISIQSALTGHLVLSTLHANRASQVFGRLIDMDVEAFLASASIIGSMSQRLVRRLCFKCLKSVAPNATIQKRFGLDPEINLYTTQGCEFCSRTGFKGRLGIFETMLIDDKIQELILAKAPAGQIEEAARAADFTTMAEDGLEKAVAGLTTIEEVMRVVG